MPSRWRTNAWLARVGGIAIGIALICLASACASDSTEFAPTPTPESPERKTTPTSSTARENPSTLTPEPTAISTSSPEPTAAPVPTRPPEPEVPPPSVEYLNPESAIRNALREGLGREFTPNPFGYTALSTNRPYLVRNLYHLATAEVGHFNVDTTDFYPWLVDYFKVVSGESHSTDYVPEWSILQDHLYEQAEAALFDQDSELAQTLLAFELDRDLGDPGVETYWLALLGPVTLVNTRPTQLSSHERQFHSLMEPYGDALVLGSVQLGDFVPYLWASGYLDEWFDTLDGYRENR